MRDSVEARIDLTYPRKDGTTLYDHYKHIEQTKGVRDALLDKASPPIYFEEEWDMYWMLRRGESLQCTEILAYSQLTGMPFGEYEVNTLLLIDDFVSSRIRYHERQSMEKK